MNQKHKKYIPPEFQPILWSKNVKELDLENDKNYIVHQILSYGNFRQIEWLLKTYGKEKTRKVFVNYPKNVYIPSVFYFVKNFILNLRKKQLKEKYYVKTLF